MQPQKRIDNASKQEYTRLCAHRIGEMATMEWQWPITLSAFVIGAALVGYSSIRTRRPRKALEVSLIPPNLILFVGVLLVLLSGSHALTLLGIVHNKGQLRFR
jgi:hypothetical protein